MDFTEDPDEEEIALCDEDVLASYLQADTVETETICDMIRNEKLFPCYFGSGLKLVGMEAFLHGLDIYTKMPDYDDDFSAVIYKIGRDDQGNRLTYMKITGGTLKVRAPIIYRGKKNGLDLEEKVNQIRIYSGTRYYTVEEATAGMVCAVLGFSETSPGMTMGTISQGYTPALEAVLNYRIVLPEDTDAASFLPKMRLLEEEDPELHVYWDEHLREIYVRLMGAVQIEILKSIVEDRFGVTIDIVDGRILYKETIADAVVGMWRASVTLSLCVIMPKFIFCWNRWKPAVVLYWIQNAMKISLTVTGRG